MSGAGGGMPADFEITVRGELGPVLRWALRPVAVVTSQCCTVIRTSAGTDLVGLVRALDARGLQIEGVWVERRGLPS